jgi:uncharacterized membrane protein YjjB (DUF3815 family)
MDKLKSILFSARIKSLVWRGGMMFVAGGVQFLADNLVSLEISTEATVLAGLILGEISKHLNNKYKGK